MADLLLNQSHKGHAVGVLVGLPDMLRHLVDKVWFLLLHLEIDIVLNKDQQCDRDHFVLDHCDFFTRYLLGMSLV